MFADGTITHLMTLTSRFHLLAPKPPTPARFICTCPLHEQLVPLVGSKTSSLSKAYEQIFGARSEVAELPKAASAFGNLDTRGKDPASILFDVPAHVLPPMDTIAGKFIDMLLRKRGDANAAAAVEDSGSASEDEDEDEGEGEGEGMQEDADEDAAPIAAAAAAGSKPEPVGGADGGTLAAVEIKRSSETELQFLVDFFQRGRVPVPLVAGKNPKKRKSPPGEDSAAAPNGVANGASKAEANGGVTPKKKKGSKADKAATLKAATPAGKTPGKKPKGTPGRSARKVKN